MAISPISTPLPTPGASSSASLASTAASSAQVTQQQFLQLLTAQLQNQDPLNPVDSTDFTSQLAQFSELAGVQQLNTSMQQLVQMQQLSQGATLVGKTVSYGANGTATGQGTVDSVSFQNGQTSLSIGGQSVPAAQVLGIVGT